MEKEIKHPEVTGEVVGNMTSCINKKIEGYLSKPTTIQIKIDGEFEFCISPHDSVKLLNFILTELK